MVLFPAEVAELVRAERKDAAVVAGLSRRLRGLAAAFGDPRAAQRLLAPPVVAAAARGLYYSATTLLGAPLPLSMDFVINWAIL